MRSQETMLRQFLLNPAHARQLLFEPATGAGVVIRLCLCLQCDHLDAEGLILKTVRAIRALSASPMMMALILKAKQVTCQKSSFGTSN